MQSGGLRMIPKLGYEHISLTPFAKMRVDLSAQVCISISRTNKYVCKQNVHSLSFVMYVGIE